MSEMSIQLDGLYVTAEWWEARCARHVPRAALVVCGGRTGRGGLFDLRADRLESGFAVDRPDAFKPFGDGFGVFGDPGLCHVGGVLVFEAKGV